MMDKFSRKHHNGVPELSVDWQMVFTDALPRVYHYFCYKVGNIQLAEDLTAATFEKAWKNHCRYDPGKGQPHAWIIGIAHNVTADHFRKKDLELSIETFSNSLAAPPADEDLQKQMDFQFILNMLKRFPRRERELIHLKYGAELSNREIAQLTGLSESNVGTILHRVVGKLRTEWEKYHER